MQDQSTGYTAFLSTDTPEIIIALELRRDGYYVQYDPLVIGHKESCAFVSVRVLNDFSPEECRNIVESEYRYWAELFPLPLQVNLRYEKPSTEYTKQLRGCSYVCGVSPNEFQWGSFTKGQLAQATPSPFEIRRIYEGLSYKTSTETRVKLDIDKKARWLLLLWSLLLIGLSAIYFYASWQTEFFGALAFGIAMVQCILKAAETIGFKVQTKATQEKERIRALKEHHHYHCIRNPEMFNQLKLENFQRRKNERLAGKLYSMPTEVIKN